MPLLTCRSQNSLWKKDEVEVTVQMRILRCNVPGSQADLDWSMHIGHSDGAVWYHVLCLPRGSMLMSKPWKTWVLHIKFHSLIQAFNSETVWRLSWQSFLWCSLSQSISGSSGGFKLEAGYPHCKFSTTLSGLYCLQIVSSIYTDVTVMRFSSSSLSRNFLFLTGDSPPPSSYVNTWKQKKLLWNVKNFYSQFYVCSFLKYSEVVLMQLRAPFG